MGENRGIGDRLERRKAVLTTGHAFVWASAGTGKTHTLALRALFLLLREGIPHLYQESDRAARLAKAARIIDSVVLTTFTRKAAAEMQTRLYSYFERMVSASSLEALVSANQGDELFCDVVREIMRRLPTQEFAQVRRGAEALAERASEFQISTIHSFATSILARHPVESGLHPGLRFAQEDEDDFEDLEEQLVERWWQNSVEQDLELQVKLGEVLQIVPVEDLNAWLAVLRAHPVIVAECRALPADPDPDLVPALRALAERIPAGKGAKMKRLVNELLPALDQQDLMMLARLILEYRDYMFRDNPKIPAAIKNALASLPPPYAGYFDSWSPIYLMVVRALLKGDLSACWSTWIEVMEQFLKWREGAPARELGVLTFDDIIDRAVELLESDRQARRSERARLKAILIDEFQDTDRRQLRLLELLLARETASPQEVLGFFVGDIKQSIYRFRGADVGSVRTFAQRYSVLTGTSLPCESYSLVTSFRNLPVLSRLTNYLFSRPIPLADRSEHLVSYRTEEAEPPLWAIAAGEGDRPGKDQQRVQLAWAAVQLIRGHVAAESVAPGRYRDLLLLTRSNRELDFLLPALHEAGIPVISSGAKTFYQNQEVLDALSLLISLHNPLDTLAIAAVLRSPVFDLLDDEVERLIQDAPLSSLFASENPLPEWLPDGSAVQIKRVRELYRIRTETALNKWTQMVKALLPKAAYTSVTDPEGRSIARINKVFREFSRTAAGGAVPPLRWLLNRRAQVVKVDRFDADLGEDVSLSDESVDAVRAMTVHKAKGLEGRHVVVYGWSSILQDISDPGRRPPNVLGPLETAGGTLVGFQLDWGPLSICSPDFAAALREETLRSKEEAARLAYVAATRARDRLTFLVPQVFHLGLPESLREPLFGPGAPSGLLQVRSFDTSTPVVRQDWTPVLLEFDPATHRAAWNERLPADGVSRKRLIRSPSAVGKGDSEVAEPRFGARQPSPRSDLRIGNLVHLYLERHLHAGRLDSAELEACLRQLEPDPRSELVRDSARTILLRLLSGTSADEEGNPYIERLRGGRILAREVPFFVTLEGEAWHGVIDLVLSTADGGITAVDYKTGARPETLPESYAVQQRVYLGALERLYPDTRVSFEFWWLSEPSQGVLAS